MILGHRDDCQIASIGGKCTCNPEQNSWTGELTSLREIKQRLAAIERVQKEQEEGWLVWMEAQKTALRAIEQGQGVICERLDALSKLVTERYESLLLMASIGQSSAGKKLDAIQGALLHQHFKSGKRPKRKAAAKGRG